MQLFWCRGFEATSIQDLVDATGVGRGSLYAAFGSKEGVYLAALDRYIEQLAAPMLAALSSGRSIRTVVRDVLLQLVDEAVHDADRRGCLMVNAATERMAHDTAVARRVRDTVSAMEDALTTALGAAQDAGQVTSERSARDLARFLVLTVQGLRVMGVVEPDRRALRASVEVALRCLD